MRYLVGIHCCQWPHCGFCISHGSVATALGEVAKKQTFVSNFLFMLHAKNY